MSLTQPYHTGDDVPDYPVVEGYVSARSALDPAPIRLKFEIDTASDATHISRAILDQLKSRGIDFGYVVTYGGNKRAAIVHEVTITIDGIEHEDVPVVETHDGISILGRDILNHHVIRLDGPGRTLT